MSKFRDHVQDIREEVNHDPISCIPQLHSSTPQKFVKNILRKYSINDLLTNITLIDPFFTALDISIFMSYFEPMPKVSLEVISKFETYEDNDTNKEARKIKIKSMVPFFTTNGLLSAISFIQTKEQMHDRYLVFWSSNILLDVLSIGGSINQRFSDNTHILQITDKYFEYNVIKYISAMRANKLSAF